MWTKLKLNVAEPRCCRALKTIDVGEVGIILNGEYAGAVVVGGIDEIIVPCAGICFTKDGLFAAQTDFRPLVPGETITVA